ncbi:MAG: tetratricopeptide repeat protein [Reichenbachiella sp.]|uniref:tetratricopeptide repeat protein n=1 Tax=Reichenbachiella sp. TaxID=2184521 RepID=UPI003262E84C
MKWIRNAITTFLFTCTLILFETELIGQPVSTLDSLIAVLEMEISDRQRVDTYIKISEFYGASDSTKTVSYANQAIDLAKKIQYKTGEIDAYYARVHVAMSMGHIAVAAKEFHRIVTLSKAIGYKRGEANGLNGLGATRDFQGDYSKALEYLFQSLRISEEEGDQRAIASRTNNIGLVFSSQEEYTDAIKYLTKSLQIHNDLQDTYGVALVNSNIGEVYMKQNQLDKAQESFNRSIKFYNEIQDQNGIAYTYKNLADVCLKKGDVPKSIEHYNYALDIYDKIGGQYFISYTLIGLGRSHMMIKEWQTAKKYFKKGLKLASELRHMVNIRDGWKYLAVIEENLGNYKAALEARKNYKAAADSILNTEQTKNLTRLEANYEFQKEKDSIALEQHKAELAFEKEIERQEWLKLVAFTAALFVTIIALIIYRFYLIKRDKNKELANKNEIIDLKNKELIYRNDQIVTLRTNEKELAEETLALKERELATVTMLSHEKNSLLQQLGEQIGSLANKVDQKILPDLKEIKRTIKANLNEESWSMFMYQFEKVHPKFFNELKEEYPSITQHDLRLCAYIKVGMDNKEIAQVSNITTAAVKKSINRMKKKMELSPEVDLRDFLIRK